MMERNMIHILYYIKIEENGCTVGRLKYVRVSFAQTIAQSGTHWIDRPIIPNGLAVPMENLFLPLQKNEV